MRVGSGTHSGKRSCNAVVGDRLAVVHRTIREHDGCSSVCNRFSGDNASYDLSIVSQRVINVCNGS